MAACAVPPEATAAVCAGSTAAVCACDRKGSGAACSDATIRVCENKFACKQHYFSSWVAHKTMGNEGELGALMCRCNAGLTASLEEETGFCPSYALENKPEGSRNFYTASPRFAYAKIHFDWYARDVYTALVEKIPADDLEAGGVADLAQSLACAITYPRCEACENVISDPNTILSGQYDFYTCFDPEPCRRACYNLLRRHAQLSRNLLDCVWNRDDKCSNSSRMFMSAENRVPYPANLTVPEICELEEVCSWRSITGMFAPDTTGDRQIGYGEGDPFASSIVFSIVLAVLLILCTGLARFFTLYTLDQWKVRLQQAAINGASSP